MVWHLICVTLFLCFSFNSEAKEFRKSTIEISRPPVLAKPSSSLIKSRKGTSSSSVQLKVELALTPSEQEQGLMYRKSMDLNYGMLFVFSNERPRRFWMKNTLIPLSIAFIDKKYTIFQISNMNPVKTLAQTSYDSANSVRPAKYVLEVPKGWFIKNSIVEGSKLIWSEEKTFQKN